MKVDVYPNITNVEVYENPISVPVEATWEKVTFLVANPVVNTFDLGRDVATDRDGDYVLQVSLNGVQAEYGDDFTLDGSVITWVSAQIVLEANEELVVWYSPKTIYGSVPGSGEVSNLNDLNDVVIAGPQAGQVLVRDGNGSFTNKFLTAGDNVTITSNANGVIVAANPLAGSSDGAQGALQISDGNSGFTGVNWSIANNHLIPTLDSQYDIGSANNKVRDIYMSGNTLHIGSGQISVQGDAIKFAQGLDVKTLATTDDVSPDTLIASSTFVSAVTGAQGPAGAVGPQGIQGAQGLQGLIGNQGTAGNNGLDGAIGPQGNQGLQGLVGPQGPAGTNGVDGPQGPQGIQGLDGPQGIAGTDGVDGAQGIQGTNGTNGTDGADGAVGAVGPQGLQGSAGAQGPAGTDGVDGAVGPQGIQGIAGAVGPQGFQGSAGNNGTNGVDGTDGAVGPQGPQGVVGPQGIQGVDGPQGIQGTAGVGVTFQGEVSTDPSGSGVVTLTNAATFTPSQGDAVLSNVDDSLFIYNSNISNWVDGGSIQGPAGAVGAVGPQGVVGPQGIQGIAGTNGTDGADGAVGPQGNQGLQGSAGNNGTNGTDGTDGAVGPQGPQGLQGAVGPQGPAGTDGVDGAQGIQGIQGADGPQGLQGPIGNNGTNGTDGSDGAQGIQGLQGTSGANGTDGASVTHLSINNTTVATTLSDNTTITGAVTMALTALSDVDITDTAHTLSDGYVLTYDTTQNHWHPEPISQSTSNNVALNDLTNVDTTNVSDGDFLAYNNATTEWSIKEGERVYQYKDKNVLNKSSAQSSYTLTEQDFNDDKIIYLSARTNAFALTLPLCDNLISGKRIRVFCVTNDIEITLNTNANDSYPYIYNMSGGGGTASFSFNTNGGITEVYAFDNHPSQTIMYWWVNNNQLSKLQLSNVGIELSNELSVPNIAFNTGTTTRWNVTSMGHILPHTTEDYDIGSADKKVRHLFLSDNSVKFASGDLGVNTGGDLTFTKTGETALPLATQAYADSSGGPQVLDIAVHRNNLHSIFNFHWTGLSGHYYRKRGLLFRDFQGDTNYPDADYVHNSISGASLGATGAHDTAYELPVGTYLIEVHLAMAPHNTILDTDPANNNSLLLSRTLEKFAGSGTLTIHSSNVRYYRQDYEMLQGFNPTEDTIGNDSTYYSGALFHLKIKSKITIATASMALYFKLSDIISIYTDNRIYSAEYKATKV